MGCSDQSAMKAETAADGDGLAPGQATDGDGLALGPKLFFNPKEEMVSEFNGEEKEA